MSSSNPADHPLPVSPELDHLETSSVPFGLPVPANTTEDGPPDDAKSVEDNEALVTSLRSQLETAQATISTQSTRLSSLSDVEVEHAQLKDKLAFLSAAKEAVEAQLKEEVRKREMAEETVETLRGQVEQARRGVMTLQKQEADRKRMSVMSGGTSMMGLGLGEEEVLSGPAGGDQIAKDSRTVKRQSTMRSHRRQSSQSEPADVHVDRGNLSPNPQPQLSVGGNALRPAGQGLRELRLGSNPHAPPAAIPSSTAGGPGSPGQSSGYFDMTPSPTTNKQLPNSPTKKETEALEEAQRLRSELTAMQSRLELSEEARMASETCLKALREFMAGGGVDGDKCGLDVTPGDQEMSASTADLLKGIRLPPLPTDRDADEEEIRAQHAAAAAAEKAKPAAGWGFKLWNTKPGVVSPSHDPAPGSATSPKFSASIIENRSRAGSTATVSPLPTPGDETMGGGVQSGSSQRPLGSLMSGWTKGAVSPPSSNATLAAERPSQSRKISVSSFFSRGGAKRESTAAPALAEEENEKDLPSPPASASDGDQLAPTAKLEPSPEIRGTGLPDEDAGAVRQDKRGSRGSDGSARQTDVSTFGEDGDRTASSHDDAEQQDKEKIDVDKLETVAL
ncbi:hypothetical protein IAU60_002712 [Kwoniella sp. DSM 27419]